MRDKLHNMLKATDTIRERPRNRDGLFLEGALRTPALHLYQGVPYTDLARDWELPIVADDGPVDILIVSAAYGLVRPREGLRTYSVTMGDQIAGYGPVHLFWRREGLSSLLEEYARRSSITHVWSLLPDSAPLFQYHRVFGAYWRHAKELGQTCYRVAAYRSDGVSAGSGSGKKRGQWLHALLRSQPRMLFGEAPLESEFETVPGFRFEYRRCG